MNKAELIKAMATESELTQKDAGAALDAFVEVVKNELIAGGEISLTGFGKFCISERSARQGRNPQTGQAITIPASKSPKFKAGKVLKELVNA